MEKGNEGGAPVQSTAGTGTAIASPASGQGGQQADQSGPRSWKDVSALLPGAPTKEERLQKAAQQRSTVSDQDLRELAAESDGEVALYEEQIAAEIASENPDHEYIDDARTYVDEQRTAARLDRQELHEREMARPSPSKPEPAPPPQRPSAEVEHPGGTRTGVDETGKGYETDPSGQRKDRERFDRFPPGGGA